MTGLALAVVAQLALTRGVVLDAATGAPVVAAAVESRAERARTNEAGRFAIRAAGGDTVRVRRIGYHPAAVAAAEVVEIRLIPAALPLAEVTVAGEARSGLAATSTVADLRARGARSTADALGTLPFVTARSSRGGLALSLRAARPEQVLVLLDGVQLNDPATGAADVSDVPLAALGAVSSAPGADAARYGSGASGGVIALQSGSAPEVSATVGSYGERRLEGAARATVGSTVVRGGAAWGRSDNDFPFRDTATAPELVRVERRVNNDEGVASVFASTLSPRVQTVVLAARRERGLVGQMNVRRFDLTRERASRLFARSATTVGAWTAAASARWLDLTLRDPLAPATAADARALSLDVSAARAVGPAGLKAGIGLDRVDATALPRRDRPRAFASATVARSASSLTARAALRVDGVRDVGVRLSPSLELERRDRVTLFARASQGFRVPTFYDLYGASPQRYIVRDVAPERVTLDAELGLRSSFGDVEVDGAAFVRRTDGAIIWFPGSFVWSPQNVDRESARGVEGRVHARRAGLELDAWAGAYVARALVAGVEVPTPYAPHAAGGVLTRVDFGRGAVAGVLTTLGRRPYANAPASRSSELPGVALVDVQGSYHVGGERTGALLTAGVRNVADVRWESTRYYPAVGRTWALGLVLQP